jgi:tetratricopeptide (TPR) repeat protein
MDPNEPVMQETPAGKAETRVSRREHDAALARTAALEVRLAKLNTEKEKAVRDWVDTWKQLKQTREETIHLRKELEGLSGVSARLRETQRQRDEAKTEMAEIRRQLADVRLRLAEQKTRADSDTAEFARKLTEAQTRAAQAARRAEAEGGRQKQLHQETIQKLAQEQIRARDLQARLDEVLAEHQRREKALAAESRQVQAERDDLRQQAENWTKSLAASRQETKTAQEEVERWKKETEKSTAAGQASRRELEAKTAELAETQSRLQDALRQADGQKQAWQEEEKRLRRQWREEERIRQGRALREQLGGENNAALAGSLNDAGLVLFAEGRMEEAEGLFRRALGILDRIAFRPHAAAGTLLQHLGDTAWGRGDLDAAIARYEEAAGQFAGALGEDHPRRAAALNSWASALNERGRSEEAEELYRASIRIYDRHAAQQPGDLAVPLHNLGVLLLEQGRIEEADTCLRRAVQLVAGNAGGARAPMVMRTMARCCQAAGDLEAAAQFEEEASQLALRAWPD